MHGRLRRRGAVLKKIAARLQSGSRKAFSARQRSSGRNDGDVQESNPKPPECGVCYEPYGDEHHKHVLDPCGHQLCGSCAARVDECPFCKETISKAIRTFD